MWLNQYCCITVFVTASKRKWSSRKSHTLRWKSRKNISFCRFCYMHFVLKWSWIKFCCKTIKWIKRLADTHTHTYRCEHCVIERKEVKEAKRPLWTSSPLSCFHLRAVWRKVALCNYQLWESLQKNLEQWQHSHLPFSRGTFLLSLSSFSHFQSQLIWGHQQSKKP